MPTQRPPPLDGGTVPRPTVSFDALRAWLDVQTQENQWEERLKKLPLDNAMEQLLEVFARCLARCGESCNTKSPRIEAKYF
jgi:hypothetical protein